MVIIFSIRFYFSLHFLVIILGNYFSLCVLRVFCIMGFEFDVIFIQLGKLLQHYMIIVYVSAIWPSAILLSLDKNFLFTKII